MNDNDVHWDAVFAAVVDDVIGKFKPQVIRLAAELQIADQIKDEPRSVSDLAEATETDKKALSRLLRALASCGYFEEVAPEVFDHTPLSYVLRTDLPRSLYSFRGGYLYTQADSSQLGRCRVYSHALTLS